jgi:hypothetical protein
MSATVQALKTNNPLGVSGAKESRGPKFRRFLSIFWIPK